MNLYQVVAPFNPFYLSRRVETFKVTLVTKGTVCNGDEYPTMNKAQSDRIDTFQFKLLSLTSERHLKVL